MSEQQLVHACIDLLRLHGALALRINAGMAWVGAGAARRPVRLAPEGTSDILGLLPGGRFVAIEAKRPGGTLRPAQVAFLAEVTARGGLALCVTNETELCNALKIALET